MIMILVHLCKMMIPPSVFFLFFFFFLILILRAVRGVKGQKIVQSEK